MNKSVEQSNERHSLIPENKDQESKVTVQTNET